MARDRLSHRSLLAVPPRGAVPVRDHRGDEVAHGRAPAGLSPRRRRRRAPPAVHLVHVRHRRHRLRRLRHLPVRLLEGELELGCAQLEELLVRGAQVVDRRVYARLLLERGQPPQLHLRLLCPQHLAHGRVENRTQLPLALVRAEAEKPLVDALHRLVLPPQALVRPRTHRAAPRRRDKGQLLRPRSPDRQLRPRAAPCAAARAARARDARALQRNRRAARQ
mmetsp:Transcript_61839/g.147260  ORF Transcript_61839/g.147260 Transcript_61839/m.147260 type:complete len:222 (+) Transcript_61839:177-842(+)